MKRNSFLQRVREPEQPHPPADVGRRIWPVSKSAVPAGPREPSPVRPKHKRPTPPSLLSLLFRDVRRSTHEHDVRIGLERASSVANSVIFLFIAHLIWSVIFLWAAAVASRPVDLFSIILPLGCVFLLDGALWLATRLRLKHHVIIRLAIVYAISVGVFWALLAQPTKEIAEPETALALQVAFSGGYVFLVPAFLTIPAIVVATILLALSATALRGADPLLLACLIGSNGALAWFSLSGARTAVMFANARLAAEAEIRRLARFDSLTELPNRAHMREILDDAVQEARERKRGCALFLIDLDRFKHVNDSFGHPAGDELLRHVAERLAKVIGDNGHVGRLGGDEFMAVVTGTVDETRLGALAHHLVQKVAAPYDIQGGNISIGASVGVAMLGPARSSADELIRDADRALYGAKGAGRGTYCVLAA